MSDALLNSNDTSINSEATEPTAQSAYKILLLPGNPGSADPGSDLGSAFNLGNPTSAATVTSDNVSNFDTINTYKFTVGDNSNINLSLTGLSNNADLRLLDSAGFEIASSTQVGTFDELINLSGRAAGTYYAQVQSVNGANANYTLGLSTSNPSDLLGIESELGNLNGSRTLYGVNLGDNDTADVLHFSVLEANKTLGVLLDGLSADADIRIIRDNNGNRIFDSGDQNISAGIGGINGDAIAEQFNVTLPGAGDYFAEVYQFSGTTNGVVA